MNKQLFTILCAFTSITVHANCQHTQEYKFYDTVRNIEKIKFSLENNETAIKLSKAHGSYHQEKDSFNEVKYLGQFAIEKFFYDYKMMGGKANDIDSLERLKNPCGSGYSDEHSLVSVLKEVAENNKVDPTIKTDYPKLNHGIKFTSGIGANGEYVKRDFGGKSNSASAQAAMERLRNSNVGRQQADASGIAKSRGFNGANQKEDDTRQSDSKDALKRTVETGIQLYNIFKR